MALNVKHVDGLLKNMDEVKKLLDIHSRLTGSGPGNRTSVNVLNKSGIVLVIACWEAFVEDIAEEAFKKMLRSGNDPKIFTKKVLTMASKDLRRNPDEGKVWELAGNGWKRILKINRAKVLKNYLGNFNTAKTKHIDSLFEELVGFKSLSAHWRWKGMGNDRVCKRLDQLIVLRGSIVHRVQSTSKVMKQDVYNAVDFIQKLAVITSNRVAKYLFFKTKREPWQLVKYGELE